MTTKSKLVLLGTLLVICVGATGDNPGPGPVGRYQLVPARTYISAFVPDAPKPVSGSDDYALFRIDTATGRTWVLNRVIITNRPVEVWSELKETKGEEPGRPQK